MIKWFFSLSRILSLALSVASLSRAVQAGDFSVSTRDDVLDLTAKIQATQFLTHATFGPTEAEINALATQMKLVGTIKAATNWLDSQVGSYVEANSGHNILERSMVTDDLQFGDLYTRSGTAQSNYVYTDITNAPGFANTFNRTRYRQHAWFHRTLAGSDQLRQKMAWALAQICSVGENFNNFNEEEVESTVGNGPTNRSRFMGLTNYYDIFVRNAFSNYRRVVGEVTYHPIMGDWLSSRGNRRQNGSIYPDENYAREVMQLFSIGLDMLNDDGTPILDGSNEIIPTYDADDIREYAQVFTGLGYGQGTLVATSTAYSPYSGTPPTTPNGTVKFQVPMRMAPAEHDRSTKNLLNGLNIANPNGEGVAFPTSATGEAQANSVISQALDGLIAHPSCPPFICNRLIQRFVKSNPSRAYLTRVVNVFKSGTYASVNGSKGSGVRAVLLPVIYAILLDPEAWQPIRVQYLRSPANKFVVTTMGTEDSRLQEPLLTYTRYNRFFKASAQYVYGTDNSANNPSFVQEGVVNNQFRLASVDATFDQSPYTMPSVFNFYVADYQSPGDITNYVSTSGRLQRNVLFAPEFQIINAITCNSTGNFYRNLASGTRTETYLTHQTNPALTPAPHPNYSTNYQNTANITNVATKSTRTIITYDFSVERGIVGLASGSTYAQRQAATQALVDRMDLYLCGGTLSNQYKTKLYNEVLEEVNNAAGVGFSGTGAGTSAIDGNEPANIVRGTVMAIFASPSFLVCE